MPPVLNLASNATALVMSLEFVLLEYLVAIDLPQSQSDGVHLPHALA